MKKRKCLICLGRGYITRNKNCPVCAGTGGIEKGTRCSNCLGWGIISLGSDSTCQSCNGKGYIDWIDKMRRPYG